ncbi:MAG: cytochrome c maturation protein CcmE [Bacteroidetes bacterium]|jgi:cytochrome c-type biogenesis protein CcmE|nr:MAG: cytochrome c maturation protein CcmE [Bacteroidota bacterium]
MKTIHIVLLAALAIFVAALAINFSESASIYTDFGTARTSGREVHIVGEWVNREGAGYDPSSDLFTFDLKDTLQQVQRVHYFDPKPINFEQAEKVVIIGAYDKKQDVFVADKIIMKCPSKYEATSITENSKQ